MKERMKPLIGRNCVGIRNENLGYFGIHAWVRKRKPKPELCEWCKSAPPKDLANISGQYRKDVDDYEWICRKCHMEKDGRLAIYSRSDDERRLNQWA